MLASSVKYSHIFQCSRRRTNVARFFWLHQDEKNIIPPCSHDIHFINITISNLNIFNNSSWIEKRIGIKIKGLLTIFVMLFIICNSKNSISIIYQRLINAFQWHKFCLKNIMTFMKRFLNFIFKFNQEKKESPFTSEEDFIGYEAFSSEYRNNLFKNNMENDKCSTKT